MKKNKLFVFMLALILSISCFSTMAFSHAMTLASDDSELNWYFVKVIISQYIFSLVQPQTVVLLHLYEYHRGTCQA